MKELKYFYIGLLLLVGASAISAGWLLISDPTGESLGFKTSMLRHAPFNNFLIPGIALFCLNGILPVIVAGMAFTEIRHYPFFMTMQGGILIVWIIIQMIMINEFSFLQPIIAGIGVMLCIYGFNIKRKPGSTQHE